MSILRAENISFHYHRKHPVITNYSYDFECGKVYVINGKSGAGKTTLLSLLTGLERPKAGKIFFEGKNIAWINKYKYRRKNVGLVFQSYNLLPKFTAKENVILAMDISRVRGVKKRKKAVELLEEVGLEKDEINRRVLTLSGGQQQRVAIARAISYGAKVIFADEPTGNLDEENSLEIMNLFLKLAHEKNKCIIIVSHSSNIAAMADQVIELTRKQVSK